MAGWMTDRGCVTYQQEASWNCGMACVAMAVNRVDGSKPTTVLIEGRSRAIGGWAKYVPAFGDRPDMRKVMVRGKDEPDDVGSAAPNLESILEEFRIQVTSLAPKLSSFSASELKKALKKATASKPVIVGLEDARHFVLCEGPAKKLFGSWFNQYVFIDPADGHVYTGAHVSDNKVVFRRYDSKVDDLLWVKGKMKSRSKAAIKSEGIKLLPV